jgi:hypothetical protein
VKLSEALFLEMNVESPINPLGSYPGPGYASPGFKFNTPQTPVTSQGADKEAYKYYGKRYPIPKKKKKEKRKRGVDEIDKLSTDIDAPGNGFGSMY